MFDQITITLPKIDETIITAIENETIATLTTETQAIQALREKYAPLARQNGYVKIGYISGGNSNYSFEHNAYLHEAGKKLKALRCVDGFDSKQTEQHGGVYTGSRLYLTADGRWAEITRTGSWSQWQGSTDRWECGYVVWDDGFDRDSEVDDGHVAFLSDEETAAQWKMKDILDGLAESLQTLSEKLPERLSGVRNRAALASQLLAALK